LKSLPRAGFCAGRLEPHSSNQPPTILIMKPTPRTDSPQGIVRSFPLTDYSFQETVEAPPRTSGVPSTTKPVAFHKLSTEVFNETSRAYAAEFFFLALITGISAWPMIAALVAIVRLVRNY
jgi:hypothetical protein